MPEESFKKDLDQKSNKSIIYLFVIIFLVLFFICGYLLRQSFEPFHSQQPVSQTEKETPTTLLYEKNDPKSPFFQKEYFNDTYIIIGTSSPYKSLVLTLDRIEKEKGFSQTTSANYFNGTNWEDTSLLSSTTTNDIYTNRLLEDFTNSYENNGSMSARITFAKKVISFSSNQLRSEVGIKSNGEGGQFIYQGDGLLVIDGETLKANIFHLREFSFDAAKVSFITDPDNTPSQLAVFWDKEGGFYFAEKVQNAVLSDSDSEFSQGIEIDSHNLITRTNTIKISTAMNKNKEITKISLGDKINELLQFSSVKKEDAAIYAGVGKIIKREGRGVAGIGFVKNSLNNSNFKP